MTSTTLEAPLKSVGGRFVDKSGREITLKGINFDSGSKNPYTPQVDLRTPAIEKDSVFWDGDNVSFVNRPFPLEEAEAHLLRIKSWGYNVIRYVITWEALEHAGPGQYDAEFVQYTLDLLEIVRKVGGIYVFLDPHQDVWSRFSGGSGAPLWTFYAAGIEPRNFYETHTAVLHNYYAGDPQGDKKYPKMVWPTNYTKLAVGTLFTLFFAGRVLAPKCVIDGVNIQDYLQGHFVRAFQHLLSAIAQKKPHLLQESVLGIELMNEPGKGFVGVSDITDVGKTKSSLCVGPTPSVFESLLLGSGYASEVDFYETTPIGPVKTKRVSLEPKGVKMWCDNDYADKYGFKRHSDWPLGQCIWALHGVWDADTKQVLNLRYFAQNPSTLEPFPPNYFVDDLFVQYYRGWFEHTRAVLPKHYLFLNSLVLQRPPKLIGSDLIDDYVVFTPHFYDGLTLVNKNWTNLYSVDTLGVVRGKYKNPLFALVFGSKNIKNCFKKQFQEIKSEAAEYLGPNVPVVMSETGIPFDMDNKKAYTTGDYTKQKDALDVISYALEGSNMSHTYWCYCGVNSHEYGDYWNREDFTFWSPDDCKAAQSAKIESSTSESSDPLLDKAAQAAAGAGADTDGCRGEKGFIRPFIPKCDGTVVATQFDIDTCRFTATLEGGATGHATEIYLPSVQFDWAHVQVHVSGGEFTLDADKQLLVWRHGVGRQQIEVVGPCAEQSLYARVWAYLQSWFGA